MDSTHPNIQTFLRFSEAGANDDLDTLRTVLADDAVFTVHGTSQIAGVYVGPDEVHSARVKGRELTGSTVHLDREPFLVDDDSLMYVARLRATRNGKSLDTHNAYLYRFGPDGRIVEGHTIPFDQAVADAFWGDE